MFVKGEKILGKCCTKLKKKRKAGRQEDRKESRKESALGIFPPILASSYAHSKIATWTRTSRVKRKRGAAQHDLNKVKTGQESRCGLG